MFAKLFRGIFKLIGFLLALIVIVLKFILLAIGRFIYQQLRIHVEDTLMTDASVKRQRQRERDELRRLALSRARKQAYDE